MASTINPTRMEARLGLTEFPMMAPKAPRMPHPGTAHHAHQRSSQKGQPQQEALIEGQVNALKSSSQLWLHSSQRCSR